MHCLEFSPLLRVRSLLSGNSITAHGWVGWRAIGDAALVHSTLDQDIAVVSPGFSPGILHLPVVSAAAVGAVTDGKHTMVEVGSASSSEDTTRVHLEAHLVSLDGNADWTSVGNSVKEVGL